jgi:hypothetical protein
MSAHIVEVTFKVKVRVNARSGPHARSSVFIWAERFCDCGIFEDASEDGTCDPKITAGHGEVEDVEVLKLSRGRKECGSGLQGGE